MNSITSIEESNIKKIDGETRHTRSTKTDEGRGAAKKLKRELQRRKLVKPRRRKKKEENYAPGQSYTEKKYCREEVQMRRRFGARGFILRLLEVAGAFWAAFCFAPHHSGTKKNEIRSFRFFCAYGAYFCENFSGK